MSTSISIETKEVEKMISTLLKRVERPKPLMENLYKWINSLTKKMFTGKRPDNNTVRGVKWPKLAEKTVNRKKQLVKQGKAIATRPMVQTGKLRDSLKKITETEKGFVYGTNLTTTSGFKYPGFHNSTRFPFLFVKKNEFAQIQKMAVDFLNGKLKGFNSYTKG